MQFHSLADTNIFKTEASVEPIVFWKLVKGTRDVENTLGSKGERVLLDRELSKRESLRG
jgi:hypothetical protein